MLFRRKTQPTFDDVASDAIKEVRRRLNAAARDALANAATSAIGGDVRRAKEYRADAQTLVSFAISIPLDMIEMERRGVTPFAVK